MSYTAEIQSPIAEATIVAERQPALSKKPLSKNQFVTETEAENPSAMELFSYAVCCAGQGLIWALYLVLVITVPALIGRGISFGLPL